MQVKNRLSLDASISLAIFVVVFAVYFLTLCPTIYPGPSADAVCDVRGVGLTPPSAAPVWLILGRLFGKLSSNTAYMLNLMSAFFGAVTIAFLYAVLSQFSHTTTAEEEARYQPHPYLRQVLALSGSLLVAFSHPFWEGSVLAGSDTLNTFFLVLIVYLMARYVKSGKSRYAIVFGLVYGLAITNYPTLLLLAPIFVIFLLVRCRALLDDPVAVVLMFVLFGVGLLPALYEPRAYFVQGKDYVVHAKTFGQASSAFVETYFRSMKLLFFQKNTFQDWIFWLLLPTFAPIVFLLWLSGGEYERGSPVATRLTYLLRYVFILLFTVVGLAHLWGFRLGPVGMAARLDFLKYSRYLGSHVVVGAWLSYVMGYWIVIGTGKFKATGTAPEPKVKYRKIGYVVGIIVALALPVSGFIMNYGNSTKRGAKYAEHFAKGLLRSSPENAIIIVPEDPLFGSIGGPLRYFESQEVSSSGQGRTIVDLNAAFFDFWTRKRVETARYLAETVFGRNVARPRRLFLPENPFERVYDGILACELERASEARERPRPICGLVNNFFLSALRGGNDVMNKDYEAEPAGLLYEYRRRLEYRDRSKVIKDNKRLWKELWSSLGVSDEPEGQKRRSEVEEYILGEYSKSANDLGVYCQLAGELDLAQEYYDGALMLSPENRSALWNKAFLMAGRGQKEPAEKLFRKYRTVLEKQREPEPDFVRKFGVTVNFGQLMDLELVLAAREGGKAEARRLALLRLASDIVPGNARVREKIGDVLLSWGGAFSAQDARKAVSEYLAALERTDPNNKQETRRILVKLGDLYARLGRNSEAEKLFKKAQGPDDILTQLLMMEFYLGTDQKPSEVKRLGTSIIERRGADEQEEKKLAPARREAAIIMTKVLLKSDGLEKAREFLNQYVKEHPQQTEMLLRLAAQLRNDPRFDALTMWVVEKHAELMKDLPVAWLSQLAEVYVRQKRYEAVIALKAPVVPRPNMNVASFHYFRGRAYEGLGRSAEARESYKEARSFLPEEYGDLGIVVTNTLSWLYFKNGEYEKAQELIEEAMARDAANSIVWDTYGWIMYKRTGDLDKALELIEGSHLANPDIGIISYHFGKLLMRKGLDERAMPLLERAVESGIEGQEELDDAQRILKEWRAKTGAAGSDA